MKKWMVATAGTLLAGSMFVLAACGGGGSVGKLKGNFKEEATAEELGAALELLDASKLFGDVESDDWSLGLQFLSDFSVSVKVSAKGRGQSESMSMDESMNADYKLVLSAEEILGAGSLKLKMSSKDSSDPEANSSETISVKAYNDSNYVYLENTSPDADKSSAKVKVGLEDFADLMSDSVDMEELYDLFDYTATDFSALAEELDALVEEGFKVYLDTSSGFKMKISATEALLVDLLEDSLDMGSMLSYMDLEYKSMVFDMYFAIDKDGKFQQVSVDMDVNIALSMQESGVKMSGSIIMKGGIALKAYNGTVKLPNGIADDSSYVSVM